MRITRTVLVSAVFAFITVNPCAAADWHQRITEPIGKAINFVIGLVPFVGDDKDKEDNNVSAQEAENLTVVGTVRFTHDGFILIYSPTKATIAAGTKLMTLDKEGIPKDVELTMSAEKKGSFLVADVVRGDPKSGELVVTAPQQIASRKPSEYQLLP